MEQTKKRRCGATTGWRRCNFFNPGSSLGISVRNIPLLEFKDTRALFFQEVFKISDLTGKGEIG